MIVLSFNVRGLGGSLKRKKIKELVRSHRVDFLAVQETKMEVISESLCISLWGYQDCDWVYLPSVGRSGGILSMWRKSEEKFIFSFIWEGFVGVCLDWGVHAKRWFVINIYSKCESSGEKKVVEYVGSLAKFFRDWRLVFCW